MQKIKNNSFRGLTVYKKAFKLTMDIFCESKSFPTGEKYDLTLQIRKSSRSVCACIGEAYRKRKYEAHFISKTTDADMENTETQVWFDFAVECEYLSEEKYNDFISRSEEIGRMLNHMIENPEQYLTKNEKAVKAIQ